VNELLAWVLGMVDSVDPIMRTVLAGVGVMLETSVLVGLIIPGDSIVIVASLATDNPFVNPVPFIALVLTVILGSLIGESIGFALGRYFGPKIRRSALGRRIGEDHWTRAENYLDRRGGIAVFVSRFLPVLHSLVPLTVGMSTMTYRKFMTWTIPACTIWALAYVSVGTTAGEVTRDLISKQLHYAGYVFVGIIAIFVVAVMVVKSVLARSQRRHMLQRGDGDANTMEAAD
jgi:membrane-associated protein